MHLAILGTSRIASELCHAAQGSGFVVAGVCSRSATRGQNFLRAHNIPKGEVFLSPEALAAAPQIKAVYIASPNHLHAAHAKLCLQAGKHVLLEKPAAPPTALAELHRLAQRQNCILLEAMMYLHSPERAAVAAALPSLGRVRTVHFDFSQRSSRYDALQAGHVASVFDPAMQGGAWNDLGVYGLYPLLDYFGLPNEQQLRVQLLPNGAVAAGAALLQYADCTATITFSKVAQSHGVSQILGDNGTLCIESISQMQGVTLHPLVGDPQALSVPQSKIEVMRHEVQAFWQMIHGEPSRVPYARATELSLQVAQWLFGSPSGHCPE